MHGICICLCFHVPIYVYVYVFFCVFVLTFMFIPTSMSMRVHVHVSAHVQADADMDPYTCTCKCMFMHMCRRLCLCRRVDRASFIGAAQAGGIPETHRCLDAELALEGLPRLGVERVREGDAGKRFCTTSTKHLEWLRVREPSRRS